jgi:phosphate/sulfate permease
VCVCASFLLSSIATVTVERYCGWPISLEIPYLDIVISPLFCVRFHLMQHSARRELIMQLIYSNMLSLIISYYSFSLIPHPFATRLIATIQMRYVLVNVRPELCN